MGCVHQRAAVFVIQLWAVLAMIPACGLVAPPLVCDGRGLEETKGLRCCGKRGAPACSQGCRALAFAHLRRATLEPLSAPSCAPLLQDGSSRGQAGREGIESVSPK